MVASAGRRRAPGLRGVRMVTAATIMVEIGDLRRFDNPRRLMGYLGLVPGSARRATAFGVPASPRQATAESGGRWWKARGRTGTCRAPASSSTTSTRGCRRQCATLH